MRVWCFQCGQEYVEGVELCVECGVATIDRLPTPAEMVGDETDTQIAYELHEWSPEGRLAVETLLLDGGVVHGWQGPTLIVREADETVVDALIDRAEQATRPTLDPDDELIGYSLEHHDDEARARLWTLLDLAGVAYSLDEGDELLVNEADEDTVDEIFEQVAAGPDDTYRFGPGVEGIDPTEVVSALFLAADRLQRGVPDRRAVDAFREADDLAREISLPFGFQARFWRATLDTAEELRAALDGGSPDDDAVAETATRLRRQLREVV